MISQDDLVYVDGVNELALYQIETVDENGRQVVQHEEVVFQEDGATLVKDDVVFSVGGEEGGVTVFQVDNSAVDDGNMIVYKLNST